MIEPAITLACAVEATEFPYADTNTVGIALNACENDTVFVTAEPPAGTSDTVNVPFWDVTSPLLRAFTVCSILAIFALTS